VSRGSTSLPAALAAVAVSAALGAAVAELARIEVVLARNRRAAAAGLFAVDACVTEVIAAVPLGWDLGTLLAGPDGVPATADDGVLVPPPGCTGRARQAPGPAAPPRALLALEARAGGGRRRVDALVGLDTAPAVAALVWLAAPPAPDTIGGTVTLDGADDAQPAANWAGLAAPDEPERLDLWLAAAGDHVRLGARTEPALTAPPPPVSALGARVRAANPSGAEGLVPGAPPTRLSHVAGDLVVTSWLGGAGLLFVDGSLDIQGGLDFTGVVVVSGGVRVATGGSLGVGGALWIGAPAAAGPSLVVDGGLAVRRDRNAIDTADRLLPLPRRAVLLGAKDLG
jgi:hypothetical protein